MTDIFAALRADHEQVESILVRLEQTPSVRSDATPEQLAVRRAVVEQLVMEESRHEAAEEQYFWPVVHERVTGGQELTEAAIEQETDGKHVLEKLDNTRPDDPEFEHLLATFAADAREHITFEQQQVWPRLRAVLTEQDCQELGKKFEKAKRMGPTRPHPNTPPKPGVLKTAGMAAAVMDKARDAMTNRGDPRR